MTTGASDRTLNFAWMFGGITAAVIGGILLLKPDEGIGLLTILLGIWWLVYARSWSLPGSCWSAVSLASSRR